MDIDERLKAKYWMDSISKNRKSHEDGIKIYKMTGFCSKHVIDISIHQTTGKYCQYGVDIESLYLFS